MRLADLKAGQIISYWRNNEKDQADVYEGYKYVGILEDCPQKNLGCDEFKKFIATQTGLRAFEQPGVHAGCKIVLAKK